MPLCQPESGEKSGKKPTPFCLKEAQRDYLLSCAAGRNHREIIPAAQA